jgi:two-component SAPR family response regulator
LNAADRSPDPKKIREKANAVIHLYRGPFLVHEDAPLWSMKMKEKLHTRFIRVIDLLGAYYKSASDIDEARAVYRRGLETDAGVELFYQRLMEIYRSLGRNAEVVSTYKRCAAVLSGTLGTEPSEKTKALYQSIVHEKK